MCLSQVSVATIHFGIRNKFSVLPYLGITICRIKIEIGFYFHPLFLRKFDGGCLKNMLLLALIRNMDQSQTTVFVSKIDQYGPCPIISFIRSEGGKTKPFVFGAMGMQWHVQVNPKCNITGSMEYPFTGIIQLNGRIPTVIVILKLGRRWVGIRYPCQMGISTCMYIGVLESVVAGAKVSLRANI